MNSNNKDLRPFDIWFALVPFEEKDGRTSDRPVLIFQYKNNDGIWVSFKMTKTKPRSNFQGEYRLKYWREAGLQYPTTVRLSKVIKVPNSYFRRKVGTLHKEDALEVLKSIREMYSVLQ